MADVPMSDQLDIGTLLDDEPKKPERRRPMLIERNIDTIARVLAGFRFPDRGSYEKLTKAQRRTAREAAEAALRVLDNHSE
jgi:hypothetical protein